jgi:hypothetical protein
MAGDTGLIWAYLIHLGYNMWMPRETPEVREYVRANPRLRLDREVWDELTQAMPSSGVNTVVIDLGEAVRYECHPEIAAEGAWTPDELRNELARLRKLGLQPIPKLNFSACHDEWLGDYARCVSSKLYHEVCRDLIREVIALFDGPALFHLGMDEETVENQRHYDIVTVRGDDVWWSDLNRFVGAVESEGARAWVWSDPVWRNPKSFVERMPRSVMQSNWYYGDHTAPGFGTGPDAGAYALLEQNGYDQIPAASNWVAPDNFPETVDHCARTIAPERLKGFLQTVWYPTLRRYKYRHLEAIDIVSQTVHR